MENRLRSRKDHSRNQSIFKLDSADIANKTCGMFL